MGKVRIRSRIHQYFSEQLLKDLYKICKNPTISDNNLKVTAMLSTLNNYGVDYVELGPGTNRLAILIENYVFKIALDKWGMQDNINELTVTTELQPYVVKTYETNELISVCEYVTVISKEEFIEKKEKIQDILSILAESYLLGDVGTVAKNFANWGYRDNGELVILDFAYIYRVSGEELLCSNPDHETAFLEYDENFHTLKCPVCQKKYTFMDVRRRISMEAERKENEIAKQLAYKLTKPEEYIETGCNEEDKKSSSSNNKQQTISNKEEKQMTRYYDEDDMRISPEEQEASYLEELQALMGNKQAPVQEEQVVTNVEITRQTPTKETSIRVFKQGVEVVGGDDPINKAVETFERLAEAEANGQTIGADGKTEDEATNDLLDDLMNSDDDDMYVVDAETSDAVVTVSGDTASMTTETNVLIEGSRVEMVARVTETEKFPVATDVKVIDSEGEDQSDDNSEFVIDETIVKVGDDITIKNSTTVTVSNENTAEELRRQLLGGLTEEQLRGYEE